MRMLDWEEKPEVVTGADVLVDNGSGEFVILDDDGSIDDVLDQLEAMQASPRAFEYV